MIATFLVLFVSRFSWRWLDASSSSFPSAVVNLRLPSVIISSCARFPQCFYIQLFYLKGTFIGSYPMVWSLALCPDGTKQDPAAYGAEFGVVFLAKELHYYCTHTIGPELPRLFSFAP